MRNFHVMPVARPGTLPTDDPRHGTPNAYMNWQCRCTPCRAANTAKHRALRAARALAAAGGPATLTDRSADLRDGYGR